MPEKTIETDGGNIAARVFVHVAEMSIYAAIGIVVGYICGYAAGALS